MQALQADRSSEKRASDSTLPRRPAPLVLQHGVRKGAQQRHRSGP